MRVSTYNRYENAVDSLQQRQQQLSDTQQQMTTGKRIAKPSDDPTALSRAERAFTTQKRIDAQQRSVNASKASITLAESTLGQANDVLQQVRETVVAVGNGTYTATERAAQVAQLRSLRGQLLALANQSDGAGGFVFGGQGATSSPFLDTPGGVVSTNTSGQQQLSPTEQMPTTVDGNAVWLAAPSGNGVFVTAPGAANTGTAWINPGSVDNPSLVTGGNYAVTFSVSGGNTTYSITQDGNPTAATGVPYTPTSAISIDGMSFNISGKPADGDSFAITPSQHTLDPFEAIDRLVSAISPVGTSDGQVAQAVSLGLRDMDQVMRQMQGARAEAGATLSRLDSIDQRNQDRKLLATTVQSDAEDLDMVQAISSFQSQQSGYSAALQTYATVQRMSLFDYIK
jgi:flagellar hook-associated protein 3 FlgL